jgi:hypothetical protein
MIQRELHEITAVSRIALHTILCANGYHVLHHHQHSSPEPSTFIFSAWNQPFAPGDRRTAEEMVSDVEHDYHKEGPGVGLDSVRRTLLKSYKDVDILTRKQHKDKAA